MAIGRKTGVAGTRCWTIWVEFYGVVKCGTMGLVREAAVSGVEGVAIFIDINN